MSLLYEDFKSTCFTFAQKNDYLDSNYYPSKKFFFINNWGVHLTQQTTTYSILARIVTLLKRWLLGIYQDAVCLVQQALLFVPHPNVILKIEE